jgi:thiamine-phosphate pyrophosphorylase
MATGTGAELRERLGRARLCLLFTPELCPGGSAPLEILEAALPALDLVQVRIKEPGLGLGPARATHDWALRVLELIERRGSEALVLVNDRVDVAAVLRERGVAGVHLGADDCPVEEARLLLGPDALIGLSTHSPAEVARAEDLLVDYLGFGPVFPSATRGNARGLGCELAWLAARASSRPVFPIGGIDATNVHELAPVGRAALSAAVLRAPDPLRAARAIRSALGEPDEGQGRTSSASP